MKVAIVEDDQWYAEMLKYQISLNDDVEAEIFPDGKSFFQSRVLWDLILMDYHLPDISGGELFNRIINSDSNKDVIVISGQSDVAVAIDLMHRGAFDYIVKNEDVKSRIWASLVRIMEKRKLESRIEQLESEVSSKYNFSDSIIGNSPAMQSVFQRMGKACKTNINVSITGETGTGKELVAKAIHYNSKGRKNFVAVNVSAIPSELLESELFGYEKGAFTGAVTAKAGKFEQANKGTIFLDEIGDMDLALQAKLLRVLQEREVVRLGGDKTIAVDVRVISATHKDLKEEVEKGNFREDLYYRLIGLPIELTPLRYRKEDILILAKKFLADFREQNNLGKLKFSEGGRQKMLDYHYPGNVRELKAIVELSCALAESEEIQAEDIHFNTVSKSMDGLFQKQLTLKEYTNEIIKMHLNRHQNNVLEVAKVLDIGKSTIYRMLKEEQV